MRREMIASIYMINERIWLFLLKIMGQLLIYRMIVYIWTCDAHGHEHNWGPFRQQRGIIQNMKAMEETVIRAAINGDYGAALHAFTINPLVPGGVMAKTLLDELLIAHKAHLPNFADAINKIEETQPETVTYVAELMKISHAKDSFSVRYFRIGSKGFRFLQ